MKKSSLLIELSIAAVFCLFCSKVSAQELPGDASPSAESPPPTEQETEVQAHAEAEAEAEAVIDPSAAHDPQPVEESTAESEASAPDGALFESDADDDWSSVAEQDEQNPFALQIFGFADIGFVAGLWSDNDPWSSFIGRDSSNFFVGSTNVYFSKPISTSLRSLLEVRFLFAPGGEVAPMMDTNYTDPNSLEQRAWGGINVERVYVEKDVKPWLSLRMGKFLTPYGIWNVDHGAPAIISVLRPYMVGQQLFPEAQTGIMAHGDFLGDAITWGYALTLSNGRGRFEATTDFNEAKAIGTRLYAKGTHGRLRWKAGLSGLVDRFTEREGIALTDSLKSKANHLAVADDKSLGADVSLDYKGLALRAEVAYHERIYDGVRPERGNGLEADFFRAGGYALVGYRLADYELMPYYDHQYHRFGEETDIDYVHVDTLGLNWRPNPELIIKVEVVRAHIQTLLPYELGAFDLAHAQVSWVF